MPVAVLAVTPSHLLETVQPLLPLNNNAIYSPSLNRMQECSVLSRALPSFTVIPCASVPRPPIFVLSTLGRRMGPDMLQLRIFHLLSSSGNAFKNGRMALVLVESSMVCTDSLHTSSHVTPVLGVHRRSATYQISSIESRPTAPIAPATACSLLVLPSTQGREKRRHVPYP